VTREGRHGVSWSSRHNPMSSNCCWAQGSRRYPTEGSVRPSCLAAPVSDRSGPSKGAPGLLVHTRGEREDAYQTESSVSEDFEDTEIQSTK
jgi:hypothetical protein